MAAASPGWIYIKKILLGDAETDDNFNVETVSNIKADVFVLSSGSTYLTAGDLNQK